ncbi:hypothetical protein NP233_g2234 [Leucocoprinus birnbaumii]|uniref:Uncharacterized protein n=1 Tax=Leucocoprinus birnbaumii TaxID=56174 RepID=A0AAD5VZ91_9AGAR|nr:hypothetical protein NP233_g2234 [Leucocoprinus birnbaumii]
MGLFPGCLWFRSLRNWVSMDRSVPKGEGAVGLIEHPKQKTLILDVEHMSRCAKASVRITKRRRIERESSTVNEASKRPAGPSNISFWRLVATIKTVHQEEPLMARAEAAAAAMCGADHIKTARRSLIRALIPFAVRSRPPAGRSSPLTISESDILEKYRPSLPAPVIPAPGICCVWENPQAQPVWQFSDTPGPSISIPHIYAWAGHTFVSHLSGKTYGSYGLGRIFGMVDDVGLGGDEFIVDFLVRTLNFMASWIMLAADRGRLQATAVVDPDSEDWIIATISAMRRCSYEPVSTTPRYPLLEMQVVLQTAANVALDLDEHRMPRGPLYQDRDEDHDRNAPTTNDPSADAGGQTGSTSAAGPHVATV